MAKLEKIDRRMEAFRRMCKRRGLRITPQRTAVFRELASTEEHPDADTVLRRVREQLPNISLDTVYRILYRLEDEGLISRVQISSDRLRFDANDEKHHHVVCSQCGAIHDFVSERVDRLAVPEEVSRWGRVDRRHLQLRGVCKRCLEKAQRQNRG